MIHYEADGQMKRPIDGGWGKLRTGMFMPRWASRITLEIVSVRAERVQDITEEDAIAEGWVKQPERSDNPGGPSRRGEGLVHGCMGVDQRPRLMGIEPVGVARGVQAMLTVRVIEATRQEAMMMQPLSGNLRRIAGEMEPGDHRGELLRLAMVASEFESLESVCRVWVGKPVKRGANPTPTTRMKDEIRERLAVLDEEKQIQGVRRE